MLKDLTELEKAILELEANMGDLVQADFPPIIKLIVTNLFGDLNHAVLGLRREAMYEAGKSA